jgi:hypothetical protein
MDAPGLDGSGVTARGGDPNITVDQPDGLMPIWNPADQSYTTMPEKETSNSVSGLPSTPNRWEPSAASEQPPDLTDRTPGTIDRR